GQGFREDERAAARIEPEAPRTLRAVRGVEGEINEGPITYDVQRNGDPVRHRRLWGHRPACRHRDQERTARGPEHGPTSPTRVYRTGHGYPLDGTSGRSGRLRLGAPASTLAALRQRLGHGL